ncbi:MAG: hypothetical protein WDN24_07885 [Sphingomonas sp.]
MSERTIKRTFGAASRIDANSFGTSAISRLGETPIENVLREFGRIEDRRCEDRGLQIRQQAPHRLPELSGARRGDHLAPGADQQIVAEHLAEPAEIVLMGRIGRCRSVRRRA